MFSWFRSPRSSDAQADQPTSLPPSEPQTAGPALDLAVDLLRSYMEGVFDLADDDAASIRETLERWIKHLSVGGPHPERPKEQSRRRDDGGAKRFFRQHRLRERDYVVSTLGDMREVLWSLVVTFKDCVAEEEKDTDRVRSQIDRLKQAVDEGTSEQLKAEASQVVEVLTTLAEERTLRTQRELAELAERVQSLGDELTQVRRDAELDPLTELNNRRAFDEFVGRSASLAEMTGEAVTMLMVDVDHFKTVNDQCGHPAGDRVLRSVADCLVRIFQRKGDFIARYGGEEFVVVLRETGEDTAFGLAERLREKIANTGVDIDGMNIKVTASVGIGQYVPRESVEAWIGRTDAALYAAKGGGRNCVKRAEPPAVEDGEAAPTRAAS